MSTETIDPAGRLKDPSLFRQACYVNGEWRGADGGKTIEVSDPATGVVLGTVPAMGSAETKRAIDAASAAWPATPPVPRPPARSRTYAAKPAP